jgi:hypothetical protein
MNYKELVQLRRRRKRKKRSRSSYVDYDEEAKAVDVWRRVY